jgi:tetratricopeptide (TPR) repeat protein
MTDCHKAPALLAIVDGEKISPKEVEAFLTHLATCVKCQSLLEECHLRREDLAALPLAKTSKRARGSFPQEAYSPVLDRVFRSILEEDKEIEHQRNTAPALFTELLGLSSSQQKLLVRNSSRHQVWALAEELLIRAREGWTEDPSRSEEFAQLAVEVADHLEVTGFRVCLLNDLKAEAWSYVANSRRIRSDYYGAQEAFRKAELSLAQGSGDRMERARLLDLEASLYVDSGDFARAERLLTKAIEEYQAAHNRHLEGRSLMNRARVLRRRGSVEEAILVVQQAMSLIDVSQEPWLAFALKKNLMTYLLEAGRAIEAQRLLPEVREFAQEHANRLEQLRLLWTEGLLCKALGQDEMAIEVLKQAREGFIAAGIGLDVALVSLDLSAFYLDVGRTHEVRVLAVESVPLFASRGVQREVVMAWRLFREAAERDAVTLGLVQEVASRIRHAQPRPSGPADSL